MKKLFKIPKQVTPVEQEKSQLQSTQQNNSLRISLRKSNLQKAVAATALIEREKNQIDSHTKKHSTSQPKSIRISSQRIKEKIKPKQEQIAPIITKRQLRSDFKDKEKLSSPIEIKQSKPKEYPKKNKKVKKSNSPYKKRSSSKRSIHSSDSDYDPINKDSPISLEGRYNLRRDRNSSSKRESTSYEERKQIKRLKIRPSHSKQEDSSPPQKEIKNNQQEEASSPTIESQEVLSPANVTQEISPPPRLSQKFSSKDEKRFFCKRTIINRQQKEVESEPSVSNSVLTFKKIKSKRSLSQKYVKVDEAMDLENSQNQTEKQQQVIEQLDEETIVKNKYDQELADNKYGSFKKGHKPQLIKFDLQKVQFLVQWQPVDSIYPEKPQLLPLNSYCNLKDIRQHGGDAYLQCLENRYVFNKRNKQSSSIVHDQIHKKRFIDENNYTVLQQPSGTQQRNEDELLAHHEEEYATPTVKSTEIEEQNPNLKNAINNSYDKIVEEFIEREEEEEERNAKKAQITIAQEKDDADENTKLYNDLHNQIEQVADKGKQYDSQIENTEQDRCQVENIVAEDQENLLFEQEKGEDLIFEKAGANEQIFTTLESSLNSNNHQQILATPESKKLNKEKEINSIIKSYPSDEIEVEFEGEETRDEQLKIHSDLEGGCALNDNNKLKINLSPYPDDENETTSKRDSINCEIFQETDKNKNHNNSSKLVSESHKFDVSQTHLIGQNGHFEHPLLQNSDQDPQLLNKSTLEVKVLEIIQEKGGEDSESDKSLATEKFIEGQSLQPVQSKQVVEESEALKSTVHANQNHSECGEHNPEISQHQEYQQPQQQQQQQQIVIDQNKNDISATQSNKQCPQIQEHLLAGNNQRCDEENEEDNLFDNDYQSQSQQQPQQQLEQQQEQMVLESDKQQPEENKDILISIESQSTENDSIHLQGANGRIWKKAQVDINS